MTQLLKVSLRQKAVIVPSSEQKSARTESLYETTGVLLANMAKLGFTVSEPLLHALNRATPVYQASVLETLREVTGTSKNWTPLVKGWNTPTGESVLDHILTFFTNIFHTGGTKLVCGHIIPPDTFPLERYNGCPFCGTPFVIGQIEAYGQGSRLKVLELWTGDDAAACLDSLLRSRTALDATDMDSLKILLAELPIPDVIVEIKETRMALIEALVNKGEPEKAQAFFASPTDILRYLWYRHTGFYQLVEPATIIRREAKNHGHLHPSLGKSEQAKQEAAARLRLRYSRKESIMVARWLNDLPMSVRDMCELMHPKRGMWVRFIRALRLAEYSKRPGFEKLNSLLDKFYREDYPVYQGRIDACRLRKDAGNTFRLLQDRPGLFARSLFANMLWFGPEETAKAFTAIIDRVPARLLLTLQMYADNYFDPGQRRTVKPLGGHAKNIGANPLLSLYSPERLPDMKKIVDELCKLAMLRRFAAIPTAAQTMYIDPALFKIPVAIGDRSGHVQDLPSALMGTRFDMEGDTVRLFMQWGIGLPAQHMDMDLSCMIVYDDTQEFCSFAELAPRGCFHSGDIRSIPDKVGTAEYIEIDARELSEARARYVVFTCNAYSGGALTPNLVVGWMDSRNPMKISEKTGVAYDPSCVQHQLRITGQLNKGLVFGVLDVSRRELIWLELPFGGQLLQNMDLRSVTSMLRKLENKLSIGQLLQVKAEAQNIALVDAPQADEVYTMDWARNTAAVTQLLVD